jgi:hypothetical protein
VKSNASAGIKAIDIDRAVTTIPRADLFIILPHTYDQ